jgi:hypothetical protein
LWRIEWKWATACLISSERAGGGLDLFKNRSSNAGERMTKTPRYKISKNPSAVEMSGICAPKDQKLDPNKIY